MLPLQFLFLSFLSVRLLRSHVNPFWHAMTVTVVYKSPFPWTVSACLHWDETTAIRSSAQSIPALSARLFCQTPPRPSLQRGSGAAHTFQTIWFVCRQSTDKTLLTLIKDDVSEIYSTNAKHWFNVGSIRQMPFGKQIIFCWEQNIVRFFISRILSVFGLKLFSLNYIYLNTCFHLFFCYYFRLQDTLHIFDYLTGCWSSILDHSVTWRREVLFKSRKNESLN